MRRAAALSAALRASSRAEVAIAIVVAAAVAAIATAQSARCIAPPARVVAKRPWCHFSREKIDPSIAAIATSHRVPAVAITTAARAGSADDRNFSASWRFV